MCKVATGSGPVEAPRAGCPPDGRRSEAAARPAADSAHLRELLAIHGELTAEQAAALDNAPGLSGGGESRLRVLTQYGSGFRRMQAKGLVTQAGQRPGRNGRGRAIVWALTETGYASWAESAALDAEGLRLLRWLAAKGPLTAEEAARLDGCPDIDGGTDTRTRALTRFGARFGTLARAGLADRSGVRRRGGAGAPAHEWKATEAGARIADLASAREQDRFPQGGQQEAEAGEAPLSVRDTRGQGQPARLADMLIAHLSDPHISAGPLAAGPAEALAEALGRVLSLNRRPGCVVITGNLSDEGRPGEYATLHAILRGYPVPVYLAAGDHDDPAALTSEFGGTPYLAGGSAVSYAVRFPQATLIVANSHVPDSRAGLLGSPQLAWIDNTLRSRPEVPAVICVHHPPAPVGMPYPDAVRLRDGPGLGEIVASHPHVARILSGHVRRAVQAPFAGSMLAVAPGTYRLADLRMSGDGPPGHLAETAGFLLHLIIGGQACTTHTVASGRGPAAAPLWQPRS